MTAWKAGEALKPVVKPAITRDQLNAYAVAAADANRIHLDEEFAHEAGFPSVIAHGMLSMAFLADAVAANFPSNQYRFARMRTRFRKVTFPGDVLRCEGKLKAVHDDGSLLVTIATVNQKGEVTTDGEVDLVPLT